jgi:hypothetical protein
MPVQSKLRFGFGGASFQFFSSPLVAVIRASPIERQVSNVYHPLLPPSPLLDPLLVRPSSLAVLEVMLMSRSFFPPHSPIHFGGSRALLPAPVVVSVVQAVIASGHPVHVGCAVGADQQVIEAALSSPSFLFVFAAFARGGAGAWAGSAVSAVSAVAAAGASVSSLAGGSLRVPLVGRLMARSRAALAGCSASVFFLASPSSRGSLAVAACAVCVHQPVYVFCSSCPMSPRGCSGRWVPAQFFGFSCWRWVPAQSNLF